MATFYTYSPDRVTFTFKGMNITGFQDGTFIEAERNEDGFQTHVGSLGDVARTQNLNRTGKITLTLMATAPSNDLLQALADADESSGLGYGPIQILDFSGNAEAHATIAWIMKRPKLERAKESGPTVWVFECAEIEINAGGNLI